MADTSSVPLPGSKGHVVVIPFVGWGHARPLCNLGSRIVKAHGVHFTLLVTDAFFERAKAEIARGFEQGDEHLHKLYRVIAVKHDRVKNAKNEVVGNENLLYAAFEDAIEKLANQQSLTCAQSGKQHEPWHVPQAAVVDFVFLAAIQMVRKHGRGQVKVFSCHTSGPSSILPMYAPPKFGGPGDLRPKIQEIVARTGRSIDDVADEVLLETSGRVLLIPGLPPVYNYELLPQIQPVGGLANVLLPLFDSIPLSDGLIMNAPACFEPETTTVFKAWLAETSCKLYMCGPLLPLDSDAAEREGAHSAKGREISSLLDSVLKSHGPNSLLYFSLGSIFWSKEPEKIWTFIEVLMEMGKPFIMSTASPFGSIPEDMAKKVEAYKLGLLCPWTPQQMILRHKATGWFVTHGGHNSVMESIAFGVPMIFFPFCIDQPLNAIVMTHIHHAAYELMEVRTGHGLRPLHRTGKAPEGTVEAVRREAREVLTLAYGPDGEDKRARVLALQKEFQQAWEEGGTSKRDLESFLDYLKI